MPNSERATDPKVRAVDLANAFGFPFAEVAGPKRAKDLVMVRATVAHYLRNRGLSLSEIGRILGGRSSSTIHHMLRTHPST